MLVFGHLVRFLGCAAIGLLLMGSGCDRGREPNQQSGAGAMATLHYFTWSDYVSPELIHEFEQAHGARVVVDTFSSNEELLAKLQGGASGYDVTVPSDFMVSIMAAQPRNLTRCPKTSMSRLTAAGTQGIGRPVPWRPRPVQKTRR